MENLLFLLKGVGLGIVLAAPVGPIGLLVIRRTLVAGWALGLATGLGVALADAVYGLVAATSLELAREVVTGAGRWPALVGGVVLLSLGLRSLWARPGVAQPAPGRVGAPLLLALGSGFVLTLANPMTIATFAALFLGLGVAEAKGSAVLLVAGVFAGSLLWWALLTGGVSVLRRALSPRVMVWLDRGSALVLIGFGVWVVSGAVQ
jgi:threonine/homoserine/homoserine lactone efflux protein